MLFPMVVSIPMIVATVFFIALITFFVARCQGKTLETAPMLICSVTMTVTGCVSLFVTRLARKHERFHGLSGLIGVTVIMIIPLLAVVVTHIIAEKVTAHLVFSYFVVYYLMFLPVGTWLLLPPQPPQSKGRSDDNLS